ncbi:hypothetical protein BJ165DRAFT_1524731 [Panaeolus papilionaceus]|nr:hypothetical protein BJ165DRAFT_1524731 [Panaeolus papilionaceus]
MSEDAFAKIVVGQRLWAKVQIPADGYILPAKKSDWSTVTKDIVSGKPVAKHLVVLKNNGDHLLVAYATSFGKSRDLAAHVTNVNHWYPVAPAKGAYEALSEEPTNKPKSEDAKIHAWFNLNHILRLNKGDAYDLLVEVYDEDSMTKLKAAVNLVYGKDVL